MRFPLLSKLSVFYCHIFFLTLKTQVCFKRLPNCKCTSCDNFELWDNCIMRHGAKYRAGDYKVRPKDQAVSAGPNAMHTACPLQQYSRVVSAQTMWATQLKLSLYRKSLPTSGREVRCRLSCTPSRAAIYFVTLYNCSRPPFCKVGLMIAVGTYGKVWFWN